MEFKAEIKNGKVIVKPIIEKKDGNIIVHLPSLPLIKKLQKAHGKRNLQ